MLRTLVLCLLIGAYPAASNAQSRLLHVSAMVISSRPAATDMALQIESLSPPRIVSRGAGFVEFKIDMVISGNVAYRVVVSNREPGRVVTMRNVKGENVSVGSEPVVALHGVSASPSSHRELRYRVAAGDELTRAALAVTLEASPVL